MTDDHWVDDVIDMYARRPQHQEEEAPTPGRTDAPDAPSARVAMLDALGGVVRAVRVLLEVAERSIDVHRDRAAGRGTPDASPPSAAPERTFRITYVDDPD